MKRLFLTLICVFFVLGLQAQEGFKLGIQGGLPIDDFNDEVSLMLGLDTGYMFALGEVVDLGVMTGFIHGFAETFDSDTVVADLPNVQFVPLAGSVRIWPSNSLSFGVDGVIDHVLVAPRIGRIGADIAGTESDISGIIGVSRTEIAVLRGTGAVSLPDNQMIGDYKHLEEHPVGRKAECIIGDIRDQDFLLEKWSGCDAIAHLAALPGLILCNEKPEEAVEPESD